MDAQRTGTSRWWLPAAALLGAGTALTLSAAWPADADPGEIDATYVATPGCRLTDTRVATQVGPRGAPLGPDGVMTVAVVGDQGDCTGSLAIPSDAVGLSTNVTAVGATASSNVRVYRGDLSSPPLLSNLNVTAGAPPTPNKVDTQLAPDGTLKVYNANGLVDVVIDVVGYYTSESLSELATSAGGVGSQVATGPQGPAGPQGERGESGARGSVGPQGPAGPANRISDEQIARLAWHEDPGAADTLDGGPTPNHVASDGRYLYITNTGADTVTVIEPPSDVAVATIDVGRGPSGAGYDGDNIYITNIADDTVTVINPASRNTVTVDVGAGPFPVAFADKVYVGNLTDNTVSVIDPQSLSVTATIRVSGAPAGLAFDGTHIYVTNQTGNTLSVVNPKVDAVIDTINMGRPSSGAAFDGTYVYTTSENDGIVTIIDPTRNVLVDTISVGARPRAVAFDGRNLYVTNSDDDTVSVISPASRTVIETIGVGRAPNGVVFDGTNIYVANPFGGGSVSKIIPR